MFVDLSICYDFSDKRFNDMNFVLDELRGKYKLSNVHSEDECWWILACALVYDYQNERCNYHSYIEEGMDARIFIELRKSMLLPLGEDFYESLGDCTSLYELIRKRKKYVKQNVSEVYEDWDWQIWIILKLIFGEKSTNLELNFENCLKDGNESDWKEEWYLKEQYLSAKMPTDWEDAVNYKC